MLQFIRDGGPFMWLLLAASVLALALVIERGVALRRGLVIPAGLLDALGRFGGRGDVAALDRACLEFKSPLGALFQHALQHLDRPRQDNAEALQTRARREVARLERGLVVLESIVGVAPLLGLVGTLHGLITLFGDLGTAGLGDNAVLAKGIAIALNTTLTGLLIAIPALVAWSYYTKKVESLAIEMESACAELLGRAYPVPVPAPQPA
jgi:biopolymer transport protein ExbB